MILFQVPGPRFQVPGYWSCPTDHEPDSRRMLLLAVIYDDDEPRSGDLIVDAETFRVF